MVQQWKVAKQFVPVEITGRADSKLLNSPSPFLAQQPNAGQGRFILEDSA